MNWTLTQLRAFVAIADHGTMTRAARELGYTTGAVSQHISALQRATRATLLRPAGRTVELTPAGRALLPRARRILAAEAQAAEALRGAQAEFVQTLTLGVFGSASLVAIGPVLERLADTGVQVRAHEVDVEHMQQAVIEGRIDVGIGIDYPAAPLAPLRGARMVPLRHETFMVYGMRGGLPADLHTAPWILPPNDSSFGRALRFACADLGFAPVERHIVTDTAVSLAMAGAGVGLTLATPTMLALAPGVATVVPGTECGARTIVAMVRAEVEDGAAGTTAGTSTDTTAGTTADGPAAEVLLEALQETFG
ncbi:LysR family transcriptional regulator [Brevibacterium moorei]|uniref:LysR family transcriptional regulator n=1 Tax=Brevibacterium moorei TaxID=2968457 RepID=UPI00211C80D7|nr:LysR family transcriptional regulator [Brevibacterium sp. 68QC2CO]MCQ9386164.1 LysR family transcriptional regulator [Brevibacterium sp. 68QC2CO]